jgi:hypothetical protein
MTDWMLVVGTMKLAYINKVKFHRLLPQLVIDSCYHGDFPTRDAHSPTGLLVSPGQGSAIPTRTSWSAPCLESHTPKPASPAAILENGKHYYYLALQLVRHQVQQASSMAPRGGDHQDLSTRAAAQRGARRPQLHGVGNSDEHPALSQQAHRENPSKHCVAQRAPLPASSTQSDKGLFITCFSILDTTALLDAPAESTLR